MAAQINRIKIIKELRTKTGEGLADVRAALEMTEFDPDQAEEILRNRKDDIKAHRRRMYGAWGDRGCL